MTTFQDHLTEIFERGAERRIADPAVEAATITEAQAGSEDATLALLYAYAPALRNAVKRSPLAAEEAQAVAVATLLEAVHAATSQRLAGVLPAMLADALAEAGGSGAVTIPARTLKRYFGVLRRAGGDLNAAADLAPSFELSREAFHAITEALRSWESLDSLAVTEDGVVTDYAPTARPLWNEEDGYADAEDRILCEVAFAAVGDLEKDVTRAAYGFSSYNPKSDAEIAEDFGMSRPTIQRTRTGALSKMRDRLAVDVDA